MPLRPGRPAPDDPAVPPVVTWRVVPTMPWLKLAGAGGLGLLGGVLARDGATLVITGAVMVVLVAWAVGDLLRPVRLAADPAGVTVVPVLGRRRQLPWAQIERVRVDDRPRFGRRSHSLEIDVGGTLYLLGRHDLGAPPADVAARLNALHQAATGAAPADGGGAPADGGGLGQGGISP